MRRKLLIITGLLLMLLAFAGCGSSEQDSDQAAQDDSGSKVLVAYFSGTGNTEKIAQTVAESLSADIYVITPADPYEEEDLDYNDDGCRALVEQADSSVRPELEGTIDNWDQYDVVLIGHPIWMGQEPRLMDTFVESYDFNGKIVTTFCTSGKSDIATSASNLKELMNGGSWLESHRFEAGASEDDITAWLEEIGLL